ncbi:iron transporter [Desulfococcaceae bacterium HSG8]|nr:iron transporter [Desulfococcaceae bacterium HSG8]
MMISFYSKFKTGLIVGINKGWSGFVWMIKILVPISFFTVLLDYSGWINKIDFLLEPAMNLLSLPPVAALPIISGILTGIYGGIASMVMLPLSQDQMTLIAIFLLISHALPQEGIIQGKSGIHPIKITLFRLTASVVTVIVAAQFIGAESSEHVARDAFSPTSGPFLTVLKTWCIETAYLSFKIFLIITSLMILLGMMRSFDLMPHIVRAMNPLLKIIGLDRRVGILWLTAGIFGISYGAAVIVEEVREGNLTREELERLHFSIGINHAMIEDPALFLPLGISPLWLWIPRFVAAIIAAHLLGLWQRIRRRKIRSLKFEV